MFAPAKINLYLHVTGRRADGYHNLDSLTVFAAAGDELRLEDAADFTFHVEGPQAAALANEPPDKNLVVKAARTLAEKTGETLRGRMTLVKNLPVASGIGGGSSDAAAALRLLAARWGIEADDHRLYAAARAHGQDVPVCLEVQNCYITADGVESGPELPFTHIVLVNPGKPLPTPPVFKAFSDSGAAFSPPAQFEKYPQSPAELAQTLKARRNDLTEPAIRLMPEIAEILKALENSDGCLLSRMSGSGATCFGLYADRGAARKAASDILARSPGWWVTASHIPYSPSPRGSFLEI